MPTVPGRQVGVRPISPGYQTGAGATADAFGAGIAQAQQQLGGAIQDASSQAAKIATQLQIEQNNRDIAEGDLVYAERAKTLFYGDGTSENQGYFSLKGKAAMDAAPKVSEELRKLRREVTGRYQNPRVQEKLGVMLGKRETDYAGSIAEFNIRQKTDYDNTLDDARINQAKVDAVAGSSNPKTVADNITRARGAVHDKAERNGWAPEVRERALKEAQTVIYGDVIRAAIQRKDAGEVARLMELYAKPELMDQPVIDQLKEQQTQVVLDAESQAAFDKIMASELTEKEAVAEARLIEKPELRDEVEKRVVAEYTRKVREEKRFEDDAKAEVYRLINDEGMSTKAAIATLDQDQQRAVLSSETFLTNAYKTEQAVAEGNQYATASDGKTANKFKYMTQRQLSELHHADLLEAQKNLTRDEFDQVYRSWVGAQKTIEQGRDATENAHIYADRFMSRLFRSDPRVKWGANKQTPMQLKRQNALAFEVRDYVNEYFLANDRPPDDAMIDKYITRVAVNMDDEGWFWDDEYVAGEPIPLDLFEDRYEDLTPEQKSSLIIDPESVAEEFVRHAEGILRQNNLPVTSRRVERLLGIRALDGMGEPNTAAMTQEFLAQEGGRPRRVPFDSPPTVSFDDVLDNTIAQEVPVSLRDQLALHEGRRNKVYQDSVGIPTVGIGFNLNRGDARERIEMVGADYDAIRAGTEVLTDNQIDRLFEMDVADATVDAKALFKNFDDLSERRQHALIDLAFNMGRTTLSKFYNTRRAIEEGRFEDAANNLIKSKWYKQVKSRGPTIVAMIRKG